jgi:hypothetical protein
MLLARPTQSYSDPTYIGSKYLITSEATGDYLTCGTDTACSMLDISGAQEIDGWKFLSTDSYWQFIGNDGSWALDVQDVPQSFHQQTGEKVFANIDTDVEGNSGRAQLWNLISWPDGSYQVQNTVFENSALDVDGQTPFVNTDGGNSSLSGQYWYFRSVEPQVTTTVFTTSTQTVNTLAVSTVTVTTTVCPNKVSPSPLPAFKNENRVLTWWVDSGPT